jgi:hypothetical protein
MEIKKKLEETDAELLELANRTPESVSIVIISRSLFRCGDLGNKICATVPQLGR